MASKIQTLPSPQSAGLGFNYERWTAGTHISLHKVPWNSDYRDVVRFPSTDALNAYLLTNSGPTISLTKASPAKFGRPISLDIDFSIAQEYNYIRVFNPAQPNTGSAGRYYYYFITEVAYGATNTTHFLIQLDVFQTFIYTTFFGQAFIERGHIGIANELSDRDFGREYLTVPEGLDIGSDYTIVKNYSKTIASANTGGRVGDDPNYEIMIMTNVSLTANPGTPANGGTPAKPIQVMAEGSTIQNLPNGCDIYLVSNTNMLASLLSHFKNMPWVTQGIVSITAVPKTTRYNLRTRAVTPYGKPNIVMWRAINGDLKRPTTNQGQWRDQILATLPKPFRHLQKFVTSPYCVLELTTYTGMPLALKPENWNSVTGEVVEVAQLAPPNMRIMFYPARYNAALGSDIVSDPNGYVNDGGEFLDMATGITNFPTFSTLNNSYAGYMANNANSIAYQHSSADWSQQKALTGAQLSQDNSYAGINANVDNARTGISATQQQTALQNQTMASTAMMRAGSSIAGGVGGGPAGILGGIANAGMTGVQTAINMDANNQSMGISTNATASVTNTNNSLTGHVADSNKGYADMASRGDYANAIAGINAKVQDAKMIQPTTSGQIGGDAFNLANYKWGYDLKVKMIYGSSMQTLGQYWLRFGYAVSRFARMPNDLHCMSRFTYWKVKELYITSANCPEMYKQALRGIFEKGVTVWRNPSDVGNLDMTAHNDSDKNTPLPGIRYH